MARLIVAMYRDRGGAEGALQALLTSGVARDRIGLIGAEHRPETEMAPLRERPLGQAEAKLRDLPLSQEDLSAYESGLHEGRVLLTARVDDANLDKAHDILDMFDPVDLERGALAGAGLASRSAASGGGVGSGIDVGAPLGAGLSAGAAGGVTNTSAVPGMAAMADSLDATGTADQRTQETSPGDMGSSTRSTGDRRADERAGAPGVGEMAKPGVFRRDTTRRGSGRVRVYSGQG